MPHPERAADPLMGGTDGLFILHSLVSAYAGHTALNFHPYSMSTITADVIAAHQLTESEYDKILSLLGREPTYDRTRHFLRDVERALLVQELAHSL